MKKNSILALFISLLGFGTLATSCEDMLTPDMDRYAENFNGTDTVNFYLGILRNVQDVVEQNVLLGDIRSDLADTTMYASDSVADIANFKKVADGENALLNRAAYYKVINQCNFYLDRVDSIAMKNGNYIMRKEMAQVLTIRAWTYMQLVQNYGRVPFITKPVSNAGTGWESNPAEGWADADNLVDLLRKDMDQAWTYEKTYGFPQYGNFATGSGLQVPHSLLRFPAAIVYGDLYLLRGATQNDFVQAARKYYDYLKGENIPTVSMASRALYTKLRSFTGGVQREEYQPSVYSWSNLYASSTNVNNELITVVPSASNTFFGKVLTRLPQIYGFDPHSTTSTSTEVDDEEKENVSTSGQMSVTANYKNRQVYASNRFEAINKAQQYCYIETDNNDNIEDVEYISNGDPRFYGTAPLVRTDEGQLRFVQKFCGSFATGSSAVGVNSFNFRYYTGIYRVRQVYLRFAEALNRAGYPRHAYAVLRGGLNAAKIMPRTLDSKNQNVYHVDHYIYNDVDSTRKPVYSIDEAAYDPTIISIDEIRRAQADPNYGDMLDFSTAHWTNVGIHDNCANNGKYASSSSDGLDRKYMEADSLSTYEVLVAQRMEQEDIRRNGYVSEETRAAARKLRSRIFTLKDEKEDSIAKAKLDSLRNTYTVIEADAPAPVDYREIDAVESLIADECALETAFEGYRFYDLMRIARHKNNDTSGLFPANSGSQWLAWQVARRSIKLGMYESPNIYNAALYNILLSPDNWYLVSPENK